MSNTFNIIPLLQKMQSYKCIYCICATQCQKSFLQAIAQEQQEIYKIFMFDLVVFHNMAEMCTNFINSFLTLSA